MTLTPAAPHNNRLTLLASLHPRAWYLQHLADDRDCWCSIGGADQACDVGEALWRLARAPDKRTQTPCPQCGIVHRRSTA